MLRSFDKKIDKYNKSLENDTSLVNPLTPSTMEMKDGGRTPPIPDGGEKEATKSQQLTPFHSTDKVRTFMKKRRNLLHHLSWSVKQSDHPFFETLRFYNQSLSLALLPTNNIQLQKDVWAVDPCPIIDKSHPSKS